MKSERNEKQEERKDIFCAPFHVEEMLSNVYVATIEEKPASSLCFLDGL